MTPDPIVYCLQEITDYVQFERLCSDIAALDGYKNIEPLGGSQDKGRDAIHVDRDEDGTITIFAYSVREDWRRKLREDCESIRVNQHTCDRVVFFTTSNVSTSDRDKATSEIASDHGWELNIYGLERMRSLLATTHRTVLAHHPQLFCSPFFPVSGGVSLVHVRDHIVIDHVDADAGVAHWLSRRLLIEGYMVWCKGLAPLAGSSLTGTINSLLRTRAYRYVCVLSRQSIADPDFRARMTTAHALLADTGSDAVLPVMAELIERAQLEPSTRDLEFANCSDGWAEGLRQVLEVLEISNCPRQPQTTSEYATNSFFPPNLLLNEPETLASNLFTVIEVPKTVRRFTNARPIEKASQLCWAHREVSASLCLSFRDPPIEVASQFGIRRAGGTLLRHASYVDGIAAGDLTKELIKKSLIVECIRRGLKRCEISEVIYFPSESLKHNHLRFVNLSGVRTFFAVAGERTHGHGERAATYRYQIAPVFVPKEADGDGFEIILRVRLRLTQLNGQLFDGKTGNSRRKKICRSWWNDEWLNRTVGIMQFLADGQGPIVLGDASGEQLIIDSAPRCWSVPVRLDETAIARVQHDEEDLLRSAAWEDTDE